MDPKNAKHLQWVAVSHFVLAALSFLYGVGVSFFFSVVMRLITRAAANQAGREQDTEAARRMSEFMEPVIHFQAVQWALLAASLLVVGVLLRRKQAYGTCLVLSAFHCSGAFWFPPFGLGAGIPALFVLYRRSVAANFSGVAARLTVSLDEDRWSLQWLSWMHYSVAALKVVWIVLTGFAWSWMTQGMVRFAAELPGSARDASLLAGDRAWMLWAALSGLSLLHGVFLVIAGRALIRQRLRWLCLAVATMSCLFLPQGTALGVATLVILTQDGVRRLFEQQPGPPTAPRGETPHRQVSGPADL